MSFKMCNKCKEYLSEPDMFRVLKNGKYHKTCFNCTGRTKLEFMQDMTKIFSPDEIKEMFNEDGTLKAKPQS